MLAFSQAYNLATVKMIIKYIARSYNLGLWCTNNTTLGFLYYTTLQKVDFTLGVASLFGWEKGRIISTNRICKLNSIGSSCTQWIGLNKW